MTSKEALNYLTSDVFTGGNSILKEEAEVCKNIILQDLDRLEELEKEKNKFRELYEVEKHNKLVFKWENEMLKKAIEILKPILDIYTVNGKAYIDCCFENPIITLDLYNDKDFKLYELLKEVLENDK